LLDMIMKIDREARVFTIDTGRLCPETYNLIATDEDYYKIKLEVFFPDRAKVEEYVRTYGINGFYAGHEARKACCEARKLEPLRRALSGLDVWICGLRRSQSVTRSEDKAVEWDARHGLIKLNPLIDWEESDVDAYVKEHSVPVNVLHRKGYPSIGCRPCTRAVQPGEDIRSGRWWWESPLHRECGLHRD
ncbi:MAG: phosphoadenylyl-sulfate reductase, partial [Succinivibrionaceae bacterium]|nr:phosphoadenylyl-sulfate reductase [Succinivibrionaceae bacterium]